MSFESDNNTKDDNMLYDTSSWMRKHKDDPFETRNKTIDRFESRKREKKNMNVTYA